MVVEGTCSSEDAVPGSPLDSIQRGEEDVDDDFVSTALEQEGIFAQRKLFLHTLQDSCKKKIRIELRFHGPGGKVSFFFRGKSEQTVSVCSRVCVLERERDENVLSLPSLALTAVFASFAVHGVVASGRLIAVESSLGEILVEELKTPTGDISVARVNLDDVLYIRLL